MRKLSVDEVSVVAKYAILYHPFDIVSVSK